MTKVFEPDLKELAQRCDLISKNGQSETATHEKLDLFAGILITQYQHYLNQLSSKESKPMTHPHAHILQAIIDGKDVEYASSIPEWMRIKDNATAMSHLIHGFTVYKFRIKPTTVTINGVELEDDRITVSEYHDGIYFIESISNSALYEWQRWGKSAFHEIHIKRGIAHRTKDGAIAFCKARLGIKD